MPDMQQSSTTLITDISSVITTQCYGEQSVDETQLSQIVTVTNLRHTRSYRVSGTTTKGPTDEVQDTEASSRHVWRSLFDHLLQDARQQHPRLEDGVPDRRRHRRRPAFGSGGRFPVRDRIVVALLDLVRELVGTAATPLIPAAAGRYRGVQIRKMRKRWRWPTWHRRRHDRRHPSGHAQDGHTPRCRAQAATARSPG